MNYITTNESDNNSYILEKLLIAQSMDVDLDSEVSFTYSVDGKKEKVHLGNYGITSLSFTPEQMSTFEIGKVDGDIDVTVQLRKYGAL